MQLTGTGAFFGAAAGPPPLLHAVSPTSAALTTISEVDPIKVYFTLSEQEYLRFTKRNLIEARPGASVSQMELELTLSDGTVYPQKGSFYQADRQVDQKTGAIRMAGVFANPGNVLRPGQYGRVRAVTSTKNDALLVPQRAVMELQGSYQVAVIGSGVAGLSAAVRAASQLGLTVGVVSKAELDLATTRWAQGGVAAALSGEGVCAGT